MERARVNQLIQSSTWQRTVLLPFQDAATAAAVAARLGNCVHALTDTVLEADAPDRKAVTALARQLRAAGVYVEQGE